MAPSLFHHRYSDLYQKVINEINLYIYLIEAGSKLHDWINDSKSWVMCSYCMRGLLLPLPTTSHFLSKNCIENLKTTLIQPKGLEYSLNCKKCMYVQVIMATIRLLHNINLPFSLFRSEICKYHSDFLPSFLAVISTLVLTLTSEGGSCMRE